jgi:hypothetical protein
LKEAQQTRRIWAIVAWRQQHPCSVQKCEQTIHKRKQAQEHERDFVASSYRSAYKSAVVIKPRHAIVAAWFGAVFRAKRAVDAARFTMLPVARGAAAGAHARRHDAGVPQSRRKVESSVRQQQQDMYMMSVIYVGYIAKNAAVYMKCRPSPSSGREYCNVNDGMHGKQCEYPAD